MNDTSRLSGYLLLTVMQLDKTLTRCRFEWRREHFGTVNGSKNNIMTLSNKHHQSTYHYFSWGYTDNCRVIDNSSFGTY